MFSKYFDQEDLAMVLNRKVDISMLEQFDKNNAKAQDIADTQQNIASLNVRLKHLSVLTTELAKSILPSKDNECYNSKLCRRENLVQQAQIVTRWINNTDLNVVKQNQRQRSKEVVERIPGFGQSRQQETFERTFSNHRSISSKNEVESITILVPREVVNF